MHVSLFVTCLTDLFLPQVGIATVRVLEHFGCVVDFPQAQTCCGQPQYNNGFQEEARTLAMRMMRVFESSAYIVTPSASCAAMFREHYLSLFKGDHVWEARAESLAARTYELVEFLTKVLKADVSSLGVAAAQTVACHYTCHNRGLHQGASACPDMLAKVKNVSVVPLEKAEQCCGFGGTFSVRYSEIAGTIAADKVRCASMSGAETLIVNDAGCAMNICGSANRSGTPLRVRHAAEILAEAIAAGEGRQVRA